MKIYIRKIDNMIKKCRLIISFYEKCWVVNFTVIYCVFYRTFTVKAPRQNILLFS